VILKWLSGLAVLNSQFSNFSMNHSIKIILYGKCKNVIKGTGSATFHEGIVLWNVSNRVVDG
jgi:hypothetical protein